MKAPAFQLYSNDFLVDTLDWSIEEIGIYTRLLFFQWANGCIPNDTERLARIAGCHTQKFIPNWKKVSSKFVQKDEGFLYNVRLEETRIEQEEFREKAIESGKLGAEKRWKDHTKKDSNPISNPISNPNGENIALLSSSSSSITTTTNIKNKKNIYGSQFQKVKLSEDEYQKLIKLFGEKGTTDRIENMDIYLESKGDKYKSHYATLLSWERKNNTGGSNGNGNGANKFTQKTGGPGNSGTGQNTESAYPIDLECDG